MTIFVCWSHLCIFLISCRIWVRFAKRTSVSKLFNVVHIWGGYSLYIKSPKRLRPAQPGEQRKNVGASRAPLRTRKFKSLNWSFSTDVVPYKASGVLFHLVSSFLHCRQQSVQYKKFSWCLHQLFINLHRGPQDVKCEDGNTKGKEITTQCLSY